MARRTEHIPQVLMRVAFLIALVTQALAASAQGADGPTVSIDTAVRRHVVESVIREMKEHYVFPEVGRRVGAVLTKNLQTKAYDSFDDARKFADKLTDDIQSVTHDKHVRVRYGAAPLSEPKDEGPTTEELAQFRKRMAATNFGVERVERLPLNIGYVDLRAFAPMEYGAETIMAAMTLVANTDALIVDLRKNGGGDPATVAFMTSYLFGQRTHLNDSYSRVDNRTDQFWTQDWVPGKRFGQTKPVYVLTSKYTFSGAEEFSYNLKNLKRATIVGEATGGGAHSGDMRSLSPNFQMFVPDHRSISPITNANWEGVGVEPDMKVPAADALRAAEVMALTKILEKEVDADRATRLRDRIAALQPTNSR